MKFSIDRVSDTYLVLTINGFDVRVTANEEGIVARICQGEVVHRYAEFGWNEHHDDAIAITWHIDDVKEIRPDLTDEQAREVLQQAERRHDAGVGISWEVLEIHADDLFPKESEAQDA